MCTLCIFVAYFHQKFLSQYSVTLHFLWVQCEISYICHHVGNVRGVKENWKKDKD